MINEPFGFPAIMVTPEREKARVATLKATFLVVTRGAKADADAKRAVEIMAATFIVNLLFCFVCSAKH